MQLTNLPAKIPLPFATSGLKNAIPEASQIGITAGAASLTDGFPPLTRTPLAAGGIPVAPGDMNGILFELSAIVRWANAGGGYPFDGPFAADTNVGGYPKGARVMRSDGLGYWFNTADNNTTDPEGVGAVAAGWVPDYTTGASAVTMTGSNVTLTALQYGKPIIIISGLLTANLNLIFPNIQGEWTVVNNTTGAFNITCKTAAGTGIIATQSSAVLIYGDATNIGGFAYLTQLQADAIYAKKGVNSDITALNATSSGGPFRKNLIVNGDFAVWQRSLTYALTTTPGYGSADRWCFGQATAANGVANQTPGFFQGFKTAVKFGRNVGATQTGTLQMGQALETINSVPLQGFSAVLSFYIKAGANYSGANVTSVVNAGTGTDQSVPSMLGGGWTGQTQQVQQNTIAASPIRFAQLVTIPANCTQLGVQFQWAPTGTAGADDNVYITGVQLELALVPTTYDYLTYATELAICQRYYEKSFPSATAPAQNGGVAGSSKHPQVVAASTLQYCATVPFKVAKRIAPTVTLYNPSAANAQARNVVTGTDCSTTANTAYENGFDWQVTSPAGSAVGQQLAVHWAADAEI